MPKQRRDRYVVEIEGQQVSLAPREYALYQALVARNGEPISAEELEQEVTGEVLAHKPGHWTRNYVQLLRDRLQAAGIAAFLDVRNTYGTGYALVRLTPQGKAPRYDLDLNRRPRRTRAEAEAGEGPAEEGEPHQSTADHPGGAQPAAPQREDG